MVKLTAKGISHCAALWEENGDHLKYLLLRQKLSRENSSTMSSVAQMLRQAEALKASVSDSSKTISETWGVRQKLEDTYKKILLIDLEYALDKKVEQELWNYAFKNQITNLQTQAKDRQNVKRAEIQASLNLFLETASGFYLQFLQLLCTTFKLDLPFRRKSSFYGIMREKTPLKLKVTPPKKSSCLYVCQYCLVHLGDIARYRQQIDQAQTYYWHAASLVPFNGQPYNQLAILEAAKGNKLSTVFYYIRSLAVKVPFPVAATNLEKLYAKLAKETPDFKGKLSASEMITGFLQFHALVHLCTDLEKAEDLGEKLATGLSAHVTSQSFPWQVLVQIVAINLFAMNHVQPAHPAESDSMSNGEDNLTDDETKCFNLVFILTVTMLDILLQFTPKQEHKAREYFTLPAIKLLLDWFKLNPHNFDKPTLKFSPLWVNLCKVLNNIQTQEGEEDLTKYEDVPLHEDAELRCFQPIEKAQSYSYSKIPADGLPVEVEIQLRCQRLLDHGRWIMNEHPSVNLTAQVGKSGKCQFMSTSQPQPGTLRTTTNLAVLDSSPAPSPERKSNRQNVAIQAIMQKQAKDNKENIKMKGDPSSPKYLLGVPTSEPVFFKSGSGRQSSQSSPSASKSPGTSGNVQTGGVLVLKNQDHLSQTGPGSKSIPIPQQQQKSQSWQQQQRGPAPTSSSWQQPSKAQLAHQQQQQQQQQQSMVGKQGWQNSQISPQDQQKGQGQMSPWQQQQQQQQQPQNTYGQAQMSPQGSPGQWQFPNPHMFGRNDLRNSPMSSQQSLVNRPPPPTMMSLSNMAMMPQQAPIYSPVQPRPGLIQGQNKGQGQSVGSQGDEQFLSESQIKGQMSQGQMSQYNDMMNNRYPKQPMVPEGLNSQGDRMGVLNMSSFGSGDGTGYPFGPGQPPSMFRHPPPPPNTRFPPPPNFTAPPIDLQGNLRPGLQTQQMGLQGGQANFSHAPGTERPMGVRPANPAQSQNQQQMQMPFPQGQFMNPMQPPFMGLPNLPNNQMKSPLEGLFGKPRFHNDEFPPNVADIIGTLTKMTIQQSRDSSLPPQRVGHSAFQGHAEGTPKPENFYNQQQRSSSVPVVNIDMDAKLPESLPVTTATPPSQVTHQQPQQGGTYSLFSGSPWLSSGDSKSLGSSPFSSQSSSMRNSPDPNLDTFNPDNKSGQMPDMGLRYSNAEDRGAKQAQAEQPNAGPFFQNNMQSIWSNPSQSPLERLLELQKQQRQMEPH